MSYENFSIDYLRQFASNYKLNGVPIKGRSKDDIIAKLKKANVDMTILTKKAAADEAEGTRITAKTKPSYISLVHSDWSDNWQRKHNFEERQKEMKHSSSTSMTIDISHEKTSVATQKQSKKYHKSIYEKLTSQILKYSTTTKCSGDEDVAIQWLNYIIQKENHQACLISSFHTNLSRFHGIHYLIGKNLVIIPPEFETQISDCMHPLIFIPFGVRKTASDGHSNLIIIDNVNATYERFDPNGYLPTNYYKEADEWLEHAFRNYLPSNSPIKYYKFVSARESCPVIGPQAKAGLNPKCKNEPQGYCMIFSIMYAHLRMLLPEASRSEVYDLWMNNVTASQLLNLILCYQTWMEETVKVLQIIIIIKKFLTRHPPSQLMMTSMFPIQQFADEIADSICGYDVTVISSSTSSGKSVFVPIHALHTLGGGTNKNLRMMVTMPTVIAAQRITSYQQTRQSEISVDYSAGGHYASSHAQLTYVTPGFAVQKLLQPRHHLLKEKFTLCDIIMIDEAHVQSRDNFLLLRMLRYRQFHLLEIPKIIITSASMECKLFDSLFWNVNILQFDCPPFPIQTIHYKTEFRTMEDAILRQYWHPYKITHVPGNVLIFCDSARSVERIVESLSSILSHEFDILPLYSALEEKQAEMVMERITRQPEQNNKYFILVSTNMTESSVTIRDIVHVYDLQTEKVLIMNPRTRINELTVRHISKSSMHQRRGRTGRTCPGYYYIIHPFDHHELESFSDSEFERTNTADTVLMLATYSHNINIPTIEDLLFPTNEQILDAAKKYLMIELKNIRDVVGEVLRFVMPIDKLKNHKNRQKCSDSRQELISRHMINPLDGSMSVMGKFCPQLPLHLDFSTWLFCVTFPQIYEREITFLQEQKVQANMLPKTKTRMFYDSDIEEVVEYDYDEKHNSDIEGVVEYDYDEKHKVKMEYPVSHNQITHEFLMFLSIIAVVSDGQSSMFYYPLTLLQTAFKNNRQALMMEHQTKYYKRFQGMNDIQTALNIYYEHLLVSSCSTRQNNHQANVAWCAKNSLNKKVLELIDSKYIFLYKLIHKKLGIQILYNDHEFWKQKTLFEEKVQQERINQKQLWKPKDDKIADNTFIPFCTIYPETMNHELKLYKHLFPNYSANINTYGRSDYINKRHETRHLNFKTSFLDQAKKPSSLHYVFPQSITSAAGPRMLMSFTFT